MNLNLIKIARGGINLENIIEASSGLAASNEALLNCLSTQVINHARVLISCKRFDRVYWKAANNKEKGDRGRGCGSATTTTGPVYYKCDAARLLL